MPKQIFVLVGSLVLNCVGLTAGYVTSSSLTGSGFLCNSGTFNLPPSDTCSTFDVSADGTYSSPDGSNSVRVSSDHSGSAAHGNLAAQAGITLQGGMPLYHVFATETETAQSSELWTLFTGLGGGFVDISAFATLGGSDYSFAHATATFQNISATSLNLSFGFHGVLDPGPQEFLDGVPFLVSSSVTAFGPGLLPSPDVCCNAASGTLDNFKIVVTDRNRNILTDYTLTVSDVPEPRMFVPLLATLAAAAIIVRKRRATR